MDIRELDRLDKWVDYTEVPCGLETEIDCMEKLEFETLDNYLLIIINFVTYIRWIM
jgi:hypothetical protein